MSGILEVKTIILSVIDANKSESKSSLLRLNDYQVERIIHYKAKITDKSQIIDHLDDFNHRVNASRDQFEGNNYLAQQKDLIQNMKDVVSNENHAEHMYFIPLKDQSMFIVRQLYNAEKRLFKGMKYKLIQMIYKIDANLEKLKFSLFDHEKMYDGIKENENINEKSEGKDEGNEERDRNEEREVD
jgi:hypothetical protein